MIIKLIAEILAGTQVPRSLGPQFLGAATKPWDKLRDELGLFGWKSAEQIEKVFHECLIEKEFKLSSTDDVIR